MGIAYWLSGVKVSITSSSVVSSSFSNFLTGFVEPLHLSANLISDPISGQNRIYKYKNLNFGQVRIYLRQTFVSLVSCPTCQHSSRNDSRIANMQPPIKTTNTPPTLARPSSLAAPLPAESSYGYENVYVISKMNFWKKAINFMPCHAHVSML